MSYQLLNAPYRLIRRAGVLDVTCLMHGQIGKTAPPAVPDGYAIETPDQQQLGEAIERGEVAEQIGPSSQLANQTRAVVVARFSDGNRSRIVSHLWICRDRVDAADNFSRAPHLGTSVILPPECVFIYNAWTDPEHRGRSLVAAMLETVAAGQLLGARELMTTMDWTNKASRRAFRKFGMRDCGLIWRCGRGRWQCSVVPSFGRETGLQLADSAPGVRFVTGSRDAPA